MDDLVGKTLGRYQVTSLVGRGGMATVYQALDPALKRVVAIKVMHSHLAADPAFVGRFRHEAQGVATLRHPNIVKVFDFGNEGESYYMVMEFIEGPTVASLMGAAATGRAQSGGAPAVPRGGLSTGEILRIFLPLCSALDYATARGMVHRDIKPANILLTPDGEPILTDYGIARIMSATSYTASGMVLGSAHYMSPEQVQGFPADHRSDIYSLGVVLFEALAGRVPYDADTTASILAQHISAAVPSARVLNPELPEEIQTVLDRALAKDPERRYQRAGDMASALHWALTTTPGTAPGPAPVGVPAAVPQVAVGSGVPAGAGAGTAFQGAPGYAPTRLERVASPVEARVQPPPVPFGPENRLRKKLLRGWVIAAAAAVVVAGLVIGVVLGTRSGGEDEGSTTTTVAEAEVAQLVEEGDSLVESGQLDDAIAKYEEALHASPDDDVARAHLGIVYYLHGDFQPAKAQPQLEMATEANPANAEAWAFLGLATLDAAKTKSAEVLASAEEACRTAIGLDAGNGRAHAFLGQVLADSDRQEEALTEMQAALDLGPQDPWVLASAGWISAKGGDQAASIPYYNLAVTQQPDWAIFQILLGGALRDAKRFDEAVQHYQVVIELDQGYKADGYMFIGVALFVKGDAPGAIDNLKQALALDNTLDGAHFTIGVIWVTQKDYSAALPHLQQAVALLPDDPDYQEWLGRCLIELERYAEARTAIDRSLELDPSSESAQQLSEFLKAEGY